MKHIINYNKYNTGNPFEDPFLNEGKGIPNTLKWLVDDILNKLDINKSYTEDIVESDLKLKNLTIKYNNRNKNDIYSYSRFGIFTPIHSYGSFDLYLKNPIIEIYLNFNDFDLLDLKKIILHELLHIYEIYQRCINKTDKDLDWFINNEIIKLRTKYLKDNFLSEFIYILYLSYKQEINARIAETYTILIDDRNSDKSYLLKKLENTTAWSKMKEINNFNYKQYDIDYNVCINFFTELNNIVKPKLKQKFNIFEIPNNNNDILKILDNYQILFKKKSKQFENKLYKIVDEVILDIYKLNS